MGGDGERAALMVEGRAGVGVEAHERTFDVERVGVDGGGQERARGWGEGLIRSARTGTPKSNHRGRVARGNGVASSVWRYYKADRNFFYLLLVHSTVTDLAKFLG